MDNDHAVTAINVMILNFDITHYTEYHAKRQFYVKILLKRHFVEGSQLTRMEFRGANFPEQ